MTGGWWHDFDFARLELLKLLAEDERIRVQVAQNYDDIAAIAACDLLISYTCNVRPDDAVQLALRDWVQAGGRWFALHGTNSAIDPPAAGPGKGSFVTLRAFNVFADTLGSQFLSHPPIEPYAVTISPGAEADWPLDNPRLVMYRRPLGDGCVLYFTLGHCRSHYDMIAPPFNGMYWRHYFTRQRASRVWRGHQRYDVGVDATGSAHSVVVYAAMRSSAPVTLALLRLLRSASSFGSLVIEEIS